MARLCNSLHSADQSSSLIRRMRECTNWRIALELGETVLGLDNEERRDTQLQSRVQLTSGLPALLVQPGSRVSRCGMASSGSSAGKRQRPASNSRYSLTGSFTSSLNQSRISVRPDDVNS